MRSEKPSKDGNAACSSLPRQEALLAAVPDIIMEVDNRKVYTWANRAGIEFFGEDVIGKAADFYFEGEQKTYDTVSPLFKGDEQVIYVESWQRRRDGQKRLLAWWCRTLKDAQGVVTGALSTARDITEHMKTEQLLKEGRAKYEAIFEATGTATLLVEEDGTIVMANGECLPTTGYSPQELLGTKWPKYVAPDSLEIMLKYHHLRREDPGKAPRKYEVRLVNKRGEVRNVILDIGMIPGTKQSAVSMLDITDRKRVEQAWQESEEQYRLLAETTPDIIWQLDVDLRFTYVNSAIQTVLGYTPEELVGRPISDFFAQDRMQQVRGIIAREMQDIEHHTGVVFETEMIHKSGHPVPLDIHGMILKDEKGAPTGFQGVTRDITERRRTENTLKEAQGLLIEVESIAKIGGWKMDLITRKATWTQGTYDIAEIEPSAPIPGPDEHLEYYLPEYRAMIAEAMRALIEDDKPLDFEAQLRTAKGNIKWCRAMGRARRAGGKAVEVYGTFQDVTDSKRSEDALRASEAQLSNALQMARAGHWEYDVASDTFTFNDNFYRIFRATVEQVGSYKMSSADYARRFCHPDDAALVGNETRAALETTDPNFSRRIEHRIRYADGEIGYMAVRFFIVKDTQGRTVRTYGVNQDITERKKAEAEVREARELLEAILNSIPVRVFWKDRSLAYLGCNTPFARDAGFEKPEDLLGKDDFAMGWREQAELYRADDRAVIESGEPKLLFEEVQTTPSGERIHLLTSKVPLRDADGAIVGVLGTYYDISKLRHVEEELHHVLSSARCILWHGAVTERDGGGIDWDLRISNEEAAEALLPQPRAPGQSYSDVWHSGTPREDLDRMDRTSEQAIREKKAGYTQEYPCRTTNGDIRWLYEDARIQPIGPGRWLVIGVCTDVTERRKAEDAVRVSHERLRRFVDSDIVGIVIANADGSILETNNYYLRLLGFTREEYERGELDWRVITPPEWLPADEKAIAQLRERGTCDPHEKEYVRRDGTRVSVLIADAMLPGPREEIAAFVLDLTDRKHAEAKMQQQLDELRRWHEVTIGREERIAELKREVNELVARAGGNPKYGGSEKQEGG